MHRLGLALSGGGFRATLYHLGVVRYLRDAKILPEITHLTTVSGGSILGAHLVLNWDKYCGTDEEFQEVADEIIQFVQLDVRNRIVRRFPFASLLNVLKRTFRFKTNRKLTRAGLLEWYYERFLYGEIPLSQLPERPQLHIQATNVSEGRLCSFNQRGLLQQRRVAGGRDRFEQIHFGLATVPMAVAASSAFPGFFPPLEVTGSDAGSWEGEYHRQAFTDGGIFDNLGLRMFRYIEQSWVQDTSPLGRSDFNDLEAVTEALDAAENLPEHSPLRRLSELLSTTRRRLAASRDQAAQAEPVDAMIDGLWEIIRSEELFREPSFQEFEVADPTAQSLLHYVATSGQDPDLSDRIWLNRQIVDAALRQTTGKPCLKPIRDGFDSILVSDAGKPFKVTPDARAGGLLRTSIRSTDILMDRVWQLEVNAFENSSGVLFFPINDVVEAAEDPTAPDPEIQRQAARIRTDLDRFSDLEISTIVQHGYCVARKICRNENVFGEQPTGGAPWDPLAHIQEENAKERPNLNDKTQSLTVARRLQSSAGRRIWSTSLSFRDWTSCVWILLLASVVFSLPYALFKANQRAYQQRVVLTAVSETSPVYRKTLDLLNQGPGRPFGPAPYEDVAELVEVDLTSFEIISDARIIDLRRWSRSSDSQAPNFYSRFRVRRKTDAVDSTQLRIRLDQMGPEISFFCRTESIDPKLYRCEQSDGTYDWDLALDFSHVPLGGDIEVVLEGTVPPKMASMAADEGRFTFSVPIDTGLVEVWMLMPEGRQYDYFQIIGHPIGNPEQARTVDADTKVELPLGSLATFRFVDPDDEYRYECHWKWNEAAPSR